MRPESFMEIPEATGRVARAAFPEGSMCMCVRDALGTVFCSLAAGEPFGGGE